MPLFSSIFMLQRNGKDNAVFKIHISVLVIYMTALAVMYYSQLTTDFRPDWLYHLKIFEFRSNFHGSLFCLAIVYAAMAFGWRGLLISCLASLILMLPVSIYYKPFPFSVLANIFLIFVPLFVIGFVKLELNWRNKEKQVLLEREEERQLYLTQILRAQEDERKRIAQELHDDIIQSLLVIAGKETAQAVRDDILSITDELRRISLDLRPGILDTVGLRPALIGLIDHLNEEGTINACLKIEGRERKIPHGPDVVLYRIAQEAINNIQKHSNATEAAITLAYGEGSIKLTIQDNGKGFSLPKRISSLSAKGKLGLIGIQERVNTLNGKLKITSKPLSGTTISVELKI